MPAVTMPLSARNNNNSNFGGGGGGGGGEAKASDMQALLDKENEAAQLYTARRAEQRAEDGKASAQVPNRPITASRARGQDTELLPQRTNSTAPPGMPRPTPLAHVAIGAAGTHAPASAISPSASGALSPSRRSSPPAGSAEARVAAEASRLAARRRRHIAKTTPMTLTANVTLFDRDPKSGFEMLQIGRGHVASGR